MDFYFSLPLAVAQGLPYTVTKEETINGNKVQHCYFGNQNFAYKIDGEWYMPEAYALWKGGRVKVYFEKNATAELVAEFNSEDTYTACLSSLIAYAESLGAIVTESVE